MADLVLEGGGVKGIGLVGAVVALDAAGYRFRRVAGTSAGAIVAAIVAALAVAQRPIAQVNDYLRTIDYPKFMAASRVRAAWGIAGDAEHLLLHAGLYDGDYLIEWLGGVLNEIGPTRFGDLRIVDEHADLNWTAAHRYSLVVHTADISRGKIVRLPWEYPLYGVDPDNERIVDAVRASMSIPFFFEPVRFHATAATIDDVDYPAGTVTWVDGGLLDNFPVDVFDRTDGAPARWPTIGVKLSGRATVIPRPRAIPNVLEETKACLHALLDNADRYYVTPEKAERTIFVDNNGVKATEFGITPPAQQLLYDAGMKAAGAWMAGTPVTTATATTGPADASATASPVVPTPGQRRPGESDPAVGPLPGALGAD
ncbi:MAG: patatin-like phospholipase family protein [Frankia sp.]